MADLLPQRGRPRVALVGVSGYGAVHLQELLRLRDAGRIDLAACVVVDASAQSELIRSLVAGGCEIHENFEAMLRSETGRLDLCCLPTPISLHAPMSLAALEAGANVLVEKPVAATLDDARSITAAAELCGKFAAVGFQDIYQAENLALKKSLLAGKIGQLQEIRICTVRPRPLSYYRRNRWAGRIADQGTPVYDSPINNAFAHLINLGFYFAGATPHGFASPCDVQADLFRVQPIENFDTAVLRCETDTGVVLKVYATHSCEAELPLQMRLVGSAGTVEWTNWQDIRIKSTVTEEQFALPDATTTRRTLFDRIVARLGDPTVFICSTAAATEHVKLVSLLQNSADIRDIPSAWRQSRVLNATNDEQIFVPGIESVFRDAYMEGKTFREMACPWAK